ADVVEEPQPVTLDRTADGEVGIPVLDQSGRLGDTDAFQIVVEVAPLRPLPCRATERGPAERIAAGPGNDVERRPAAIALPHPAGDGHLDFLSVDEVVGEARDAAAADRRSDIHAVDLNRAFVATPAA